MFCAGANFRRHVLDLMAGAERRGDSTDGLTAADRDRARAELDERARSGRPFVFMESSNQIVGAHDDVVLPYDSDQHDWELELAAVIGRPARRVAARARRSTSIAGYTICNDVTTRDALIRPDARGLGLDWLAGKNAPTFLPTGPLLVPATHAGDPMDLRITLKVNERHDAGREHAPTCSSTSRALDRAHLRRRRAAPRRLLLTGSPAGNGAHHGVSCSPGDVIDGTITGPRRASGTAASPEVPRWAARASAAA